MDAATGQVLFEKSMNQRQFPASITKIMTILLGAENGNLQDEIVMTDTAVFSVPRDASHIALTPGEKVTLEPLLYAAMLVSANDACNAIAESVSGSIDKFSELMTQRAKELGATNTNFRNANGLQDENHYTTAYDMSMITKAAILNPTFKKVFETRKYTMSPTNKQPEIRNFTPSHMMMEGNKYAYEGIVGGKTGWTVMAQNTLVTVAKRGNRELIAVVMKSLNKTDKYIDTKALFDYGFNSFKEVRISKEKIGTKTIPLVKSAKVAGSVLISATENVKFLINKDIDESSIKMEYDVPGEYIEVVGQPVINFYLSQNSNLMYPKLGSIKLSTKLIEPEIKSNKPSPIRTIVIYILVAGALILAAYSYLNHLEKKRRKRRRMMRIKARREFAERNE
jgi:D-alanyl-D-alanine carboxypeptidase